MSISSRITQIEQHIGNAYDKIEDLGIDLTDVDKNIDNISSMLENVWDEYPKVTATDVEEASLDGTKKGRMKLDLKGNTEQEQLTGKNLVDIPDITLNSTGYIYKGNIDLKAGTYTLSMGQSSQASFSIAIIGENGTLVSGSITLPYTFTINEKATSMRLYSPGAGTFKNIMIEQNSTATSYEPYCGGIPSPNPEYPQQIKNVTGNSNVKIQNKNLLDLSKCTVKNGTLNSDNSITSNIIDGYYTQINTTSLNKYLLEHKGQSITFSIDKVLNNKSISIVIYGQRESSTYQDVTVSNSKTVTLTIANDFTLIDTLELRVNRSNTKFTDTTTTVSEIMLEQGTTATSYVEHKEQNLPFSLKSKNLFDGTFEIGGYYIENGNKDQANNRIRTIDYLKLKAGTYTLSFTNLGSAYVLKYDKNKTYLGYSQVMYRTTEGSLTLENNVEYITFYYIPYNHELTIDEICQLEEGSTATDYEPYYDIKAMEGTTLQDDGIHNKWCEVSLTNQFWGKYTNTDNLGNTFGFFMNMKKIPKRDLTATNFAKCNILMQKQRTKVSTSDEEGFYLGDGTNALFIKVKQSLIPNGTIEELQTLLTNTNAKIQYETAEEETISYQGVQQAQYEAIKQARSYDEQTNISQTYDELPFILDIEALKGETTNEVKLLTSNNRKTTEYLETSLEQEKVEKIEEVEEPKEVEIPEEEVDTEENTESTAENAENSAESEEK